MPSSGPQPPLRALLVTHARKWNGETEYALAVARAEASFGIEVTVASVSKARFLSSLDSSVVCRALPGPSPQSSPLDFLADLRWLARLIASESFSFVHSLRGTSHLMAALALRRRRPLLHLKGGARPPSVNPPQRYLYGRLTDAVLVSSSRLRQAVTQGLRVPPERVHLLFTPVDTERFRPCPPDGSLAEELGIRGRGPVILMAARLAPVKGHGILLRALAGVRKEFPGAVLLLPGHFWQDQPEALHREIAALGLKDSVIVTGHRTDIPRFISLAAVCVISSLGSEENSRALSEYMAMAKPVVATRVGVIPELVADGVNGLLVPPGDPAALAEAIGKILREPVFARRLGEEGRKLAREKLSLEAFRRGLSAILRARSTMTGAPLAI